MKVSKKVIKKISKQYHKNKELYNNLMYKFKEYYTSKIKTLDNKNYYLNNKKLSIKNNNVSPNNIMPGNSIQKTNENEQNNKEIYGEIYQSYNSQQPIQNIPKNTLGTNAIVGGIDIKNYITADTLEGISGNFKKIQKKTESLSKIPDKLLKNTSTDWEPIKYEDVDEVYNLFLSSKVHIKYDEKLNKVVYNVIEPELNSIEKEKLEYLKKAFVYIFERTTPIKNINEGKKVIEEGILNLSKKYNIKLNEEEFSKISYYLVRDFLGLELIEPLMHDSYVEDISCDGLNIPIFVNHLKYGSIEVNRTFNDFDKLNSFIIKLAQKSNQEVSLAKPILQGALPDGSRVEAIYGKEVSQKGSSFTIRKFREKPFTPIHLIEFGTCPPFLLAYLWIAVENKQSILVSGGTATGKTTILNALSLFIPPTSKVVSIEDTPEINLPHEHWLPLVSRESREKSEVTMFDLLKASLRERPEYIIVGEIRGKEASILFQGMATGHAGLGTVHAETFSDLVNRMTIPPISLPKNLLTEVDIVLFQRQAKVKNNIVRRTGKVVEVLNYIGPKDEIETNEFMVYKPNKDDFEINDRSGIINNLLSIRGGDEDSLWREIEKRRRILDKMLKEGLKEFEDVSKVIKFYYKNSSQIFEYIENLKNEK